MTGTQEVKIQEVVHDKNIICVNHWHLKINIHVLEKLQGFAGHLSLPDKPNYVFIVLECRKSVTSVTKLLRTFLRESVKRKLPKWFVWFGGYVSTLSISQLLGIFGTDFLGPEINSSKFHQHQTDETLWSRMDSLVTNGLKYFNDSPVRYTYAKNPHRAYTCTYMQRTRREGRK